MSKKSAAYKIKTKAKAGKKVSAPTSMYIIETPVGEFRPLYVAADKVEKVIIGPSKKTWSNWRSAKTGPRYYMVGGKPYYKIIELEEYFGGNPVQTTGGDFR